MTAYNPTTLKYLYVHEQAEEAYLAECINEEAFKNIINRHPVDFYTPNIFVKIGLGILTAFISAASLGLLYMIAKPGNPSVLLWVFGLMSFGALEWLIYSNKHYNSGVDTVLVLSAAYFTVIGISEMFPGGLRDDLLLSLISFIVCGFASLRYADRLLGIAAFVSLFIFLFYLNKFFLPFAAFTFPFIWIALSMASWLPFKILSVKKGNASYHKLTFTLSVIAVLALYFSGNYFVVMEVSKENFQPSLIQTNTFLKAFFWFWTFAIPIIYLLKGFKEKDLVFTRCGIILLSISVLTFRHYHAILPYEIALIVFGILLMVCSYWLISFLQTPKFGFSFKQPEREGSLANLEALVIGETFGQTQVPPTNHTQFGGGSFGGGGAGDKY